MFIVNSHFLVGFVLFERGSNHGVLLYGGQELTLVAAVPGQPLPFGTVGGSDDADVVAHLDRQVVFTALCCYQHCRLVQSLLLPRDLTHTLTGQNTRAHTHPRTPIFVRTFTYIVHYPATHLTLTSQPTQHPP